ncbi:MAG: hypothetical protein KKF56_00160 [Nanoarchaeota archaeon]|nr:hypothetical protein [Nanoarchaeota archaeon]
MLSAPKKEVAECVGLWLAEGSTTSKSEITFTNNCWPLVDLFYEVITRLFNSSNQRIYVYSKNKEKIKVPKKCKINYYLHPRATKPYYIFRIASVENVKKWKEIVNNFLNDKKYYVSILKGFFAGEGNIKSGFHNSRVLRISQGKPIKSIEKILSYLSILFKFKNYERSYNISGKSNWDIFAKLKLADLHPDKKQKFYKVYKEFKEDHYPNNFIKDKIISILGKPHTTRELATKFKRSMARIQDILIPLKKESSVMNFRVGSTNYWISSDNHIIISKKKIAYLSYLDISRKTSEFAKLFKVDWKSSYMRLTELQNLNLIRREKNGKWIKIPTTKKIIEL